METEFKDTEVRDCYMTSMEVAEIIGKDHRKLLRDIRTYCEHMGESKNGLTDFFKESTYITSQNKIMPCYNITQKGCEFIASKMKGVKGTEFSVAYINKFHEMEENLNQERKEKYQRQQSEQYKAKQEDIKNEFSKRPKVDKFFLRMKKRYAMLEDYLGITRSQLYSQIYRKLEMTLGVDVNEIYEQYCIENCISPTECYIMNALEADEAICEAIETMVTNSIIDNNIATLEELEHIDCIFNIGARAVAG